MKYKIELKKGAIFWHYVVVASNGQVVSTSETYYSKSNAKRAANILSKAFKLEVEENQ